MADRSPKIIIVAPTHAIAVRTARELGYPPYGREVYLVSTEPRVRGLSIEADDHIVWAHHAGFGYTPAGLARRGSIAESLRIASLTAVAPGPTVDRWS